MERVANRTDQSQLKLGIGDRILVFKANMIIPQIAENLTKSDTLEIPAACPVCGGRTEIRAMNDAQSLFCINPECPAKKIKAFSLFVSRNAMNIDGLSEMTLEKLIGRGFIREFADIYHLDRHAGEIMQMEGFGKKSYDNLAASIEASRDTTARRVLTALGIPGIGSSGAKLLCEYYQDNLQAIRKAGAGELSLIDGIGPVLAQNAASYFADEKNREMLDRLLAELRIQKSAPAAQSSFASGKTFVITGAVHHYENRDALKAYIESLGGKVSGSVSKKTSYLINNDAASNSGKNQKAAMLGIPVISEDQFIELCSGKGNQ